MSKASFKVGDKVSWCGAVGTVVNINPNAAYSILVEFDDDSSEVFTQDGRVWSSHTEPSIVLLESPKCKVTKTLTVWCLVEELIGETVLIETFFARPVNLYHSNEQQVVKLTGTYEIEVEDDHK